jgi:hypothetical protein
MVVGLVLRRLWALTLRESARGPDQAIGGESVVLAKIDVMEFPVLLPIRSPVGFPTPALLFASRKRA